MKKVLLSAIVFVAFSGVASASEAVFSYDAKIANVVGCGGYIKIFKDGKLVHSELYLSNTVGSIDC